MTGRGAAYGVIAVRTGNLISDGAKKLMAGYAIRGCEEYI